MEDGLFKNKYRIKSARHEAWDYSKDGFYFVTICTEKRKIFFGDIKNGLMVLNEVGEVIKREWSRTEEIRESVKLDKFVVMPNHIHGIIQILGRNVETPRWGVSNEDCTKDILKLNASNFTNIETPQRGVSTTDINKNWIPSSLGVIINQFKGGCTKKIVKIFPTINFVWQERFFDRIIRNDIELNKTRQYILDNPFKWDLDRNNPKNL